MFEFGRSEAVWGPGRPEALRNFFAGAVAVLTSQLLGNPVDVVANRIMASGGKVELCVFISVPLFD